MALEELPHHDGCIDFLLGPRVPKAVDANDANLAAIRASFITTGTSAPAPQHRLTRTPALAVSLTRHLLEPSEADPTPGRTRHTTTRSHRFSESKRQRWDCGSGHTWLLETETRHERHDENLAKIAFPYV